MAEDVKNLSRAGSKAAAAALKDGGLSFIKALKDGSKSKIDNWSAFFMICVAIFLDIGQALVGLIDGGYFSGPVTMALQLGIFSLWFNLKGVSYWGMRKILSKVVGFAGEELIGVIPYANLLWPANTIMLVMAVAMVRIEEAGVPVSDSKDKAAAGEKIKSPKRESAPPRQEGIRNQRRSGNVVELAQKT